VTVVRPERRARCHRGLKGDGGGEQSREGQGDGGSGGTSIIRTLGKKNTMENSRIKRKDTPGDLGALKAAITHNQPNKKGSAEEAKRKKVKTGGWWGKPDLRRSLEKVAETRGSRIVLTQSCEELKD